MMPLNITEEGEEIVALKRRIEELEHNYASLQQAFGDMKDLAAQRLEALNGSERQRDELLALLQEGATGFGRVLVSTSDDKAVRGWQKRSRAAIEAALKEQK